MSIADKLTTIAENEQKIYDKGVMDGKQANYDDFWDKYQNKGNRKNYIGSFAYWEKDWFKPKYNLVPHNAYYMFNEFGKGSGKDIDLVEHLKELNITLDFSKCTEFTNFLMYSYINHVGVIDTRMAGKAGFYVAFKLKTIDELIIKDDGSTNFDFRLCNNLENIAITGVIGKNFDIQYSPLTKKSIENIIGVLSTTTSKLTVTFKKTAINNAFGINIDDESTYTEEWNTLRNSKSNWNFSFI